MSTIRTAIQLQDRVTPVVRSISNALNITISSFESMQRASSNAIDISSLQTARQELARAEVEMNQIEQSIRSAGEQQDNFNRDIRNGSSAMGRLANNVRSLVGAYIGMQSAKEGMEAVDTYSNNKARLSLLIEPIVTDAGATEQDILNAKMQQTVALQEEIYEAAQRSRSSYDDMQASVAKLGLLAGKSFKDNSEIVAFSELMNKAFKVGGASTMEASSAMYQLTQAMASGRLQGDEFRSIIENAPMLANAISEYTGVGQEGLKQLASDGAISADVIKNALFSTAEEIETQYAQLPRTFGGIWTDIVNTVKKQSEGLMQNVSNFINTDTASTIINGIKNGINNLIQGLGTMLGLVADIAVYFIDNWSWIEPVIWGIVGAFTTYELVTKGGALALGALTLAQNIHNASTAIATGATWAQVAAQYGLNAALLACPYTWIVIGIAAVVAAIAVWVNKVGGLKVAWAIASAYLLYSWDMLKYGFMNCVYGIADFLDALVFAWQSASVGVQNWCGDMKVGVLQIIQDMTNGAIDLINAFTSKLNRIPGVSIDAISHVTFAAKAAAKNEADKQARNQILDIQRNDFLSKQQEKWDVLNKMRNDADSLLASRLQEAERMQAESLATKDTVKGVSEKTRGDYPGVIDAMDLLGEDVGSTADNTSRTADALETTEEDLKYLRDLAETEVIDRTVFRDIKVELGGVTNNVNSNMDLDGIVDYIGTALEDAMLSSAEGVH